jgi:hypothetical protein
VETVVTSEAFRRAANAAETDEVLVCLLTILGDPLAEPIRLCNTGTRLSADPLTYGVVSRGHVHLMLPFEFSLPQDRDDTPPRVEIVLDNVERTLVGLLRSIDSPLDILVEIVMASTPDLVETALPVMKLANISYSAASITATLVVDGLVTEPYPSGTFNPGRFPGLF